MTMETVKAMRERLKAAPRTRIIGGPLDGISTRHDEKHFRVLRPNRKTYTGRRVPADYCTYRLVAMRRNRTAETITVYVAEEVTEAEALKLATDRLFFVHGERTLAAAS
jgi:ribosomal protein S4E